jgi:energy-coupling factor transporter ATP-binding protein EcfA2
MANKKAAEKEPTKPAAKSAAIAPTAAVTPKPEPGLRIIAMQAENILKLQLVRIRPKGDVVFITGENGSGKSSVLKAIAWGITGTRDIPAMPIRKGASSGKIQIDLGDLKIERTFTRGADGVTPYLTSLAVYGKNREKFPTPQTIIDKLKTMISFDPLAFIRLEPAKQLEVLREMVTLDVDLDELEELKQAEYDLRRDAGRSLDGAQARLRSTPKPAEGLPEQPIDTAALRLQLTQASEINEKIDEQIRAKERIAEGIKNNQAAIGRNANEIKELQARIDSLNASNKLLSSAVEEQELAIGKMVIGTKVDIGELAAQIDQAQTTNGAIQRRDAYRAIENEIEEINETWTMHDSNFKALVQKRADAIARAKMPIPGLSIGDKMVLFDGIPFEQISNAEQIRVSVSLAIARNPKLRVMAIQDGALLDTKSLEIIEEMAVKNDYQIWIERVGTTGKVGVVMEDGEASGDEVEKA